MNEKEIGEQEIICHMLEVQYEKNNGRKITWKPLDNNDLYPCNWFSNKNYLKKAEILAKAIKKGCLIAEIDEALDIIEGVKIEKEEER